MDTLTLVKYALHGNEDVKVTNTRHQRGVSTEQGHTVTMIMLLSEFELKTISGFISYTQWVSTTADRDVYTFNSKQHKQLAGY